MKSVLVVDSDSVTRRLTERYLLNYAYRVQTAEDALTAMDFLNNPSIDLVLTDTQLHRMSGFDFVKLMRKCYIEVPVVFFASADDAITRLQADQLEPLAFFSKHCDYIHLPHLLDQLFSGSNLRPIEFPGNLFR